MLYSQIWKKNNITVHDLWRLCNPKSKWVFSNNYQRHVACIHGYKLVCVDDKFSKFLKSYLVEDAAYKYISSKIEEINYCSDVMKNNFNKNIVMNKKDNENFENSTKCWICDNYYIGGDVKVGDHCRITGKYWDTAKTLSN